MTFAIKIVVAVICILTNFNCFGKERSSDALNDMLKGYDPLVKPESKGPIKVKVSFNFRYVKWEANTLSLKVYFRQTWNDHRLAKKGKITRFADADIKNHIWTPTTFLLNTTTPDVATGMIDISSEGDVFWSQAMSFDLPCPVNIVDLYESDGKVECTLRMHSYSLGAKDLVYDWDKKSIAFVNASDPVISWDTNEGSYKFPIDDLSNAVISLGVQTKFKKAAIEYIGQELINKRI